VVRSAKSSKKKVVWGSTVDTWLVRRGFSILPELSEEELEEIGQGLTLVHFSAQPERFLTQNTP